MRMLRPKPGVPAVICDIEALALAMLYQQMPPRRQRDFWQLRDSTRDEKIIYLRSFAAIGRAEA